MRDAATQGDVMRNCLVTGGAGFVGSRLIAHLLTHPDVARVVSVDDYSSGSRERHHSGAEYVEAHTSEIPDCLPEGFVPTVVFHFGEFSRVVLSFDTPLRVFRSNQLGTATVAHYCVTVGAKLVYSGSTAILGNNGADQHLTPYAWTKAKNVELLRNMRAWYGLRYACAYFYNVYGRGQIEDGPYATVIGIFERQRRKGLPYTVVSPGTQSRTFTHIDDIVEGVLAVAERGEGDHYYLGSDESLQILELAKLLGGPHTMVPARRGERTYSHVVESRARTELGWAPRRRLRDYIAELPPSGCEQA